MMRQPTLSLPLVALLSVGFLGPFLAGCGGSSETEGDEPPVVDTTPPSTVANPGGGLYNATQSVTLDAQEVATIYYTVDGSDPSPGSVTTLSGSSPIIGLPVTHPLTLKFYGVDALGNEEVIQSEIYDFDLDPPVVLLSGTPQTTLGWLESSTVVFVSDEAGTWSAELGGTGQPGTGAVFAAGTVQENVLTSLELEGWRLDIGELVRMDLYVFDAAQGWGRLTLDFQSVPSTSFPLVGTSGELAITPDGRFLYVLRPDEGQVWKYDVAPPNPTHAYLGAINLPGTNPTSLAVTPDSGWVYVTCDGQLTELEIDAADAVTAIPLPNGTTPSGIEITPDGHFAYFVCDDGRLRAMNVDSTSPQFHQVTIVGDYEPTRTEGHLAITPAGDLAVVLWTGVASYGVKILDTDESHATTFQQIVGTPITTAARPATLAPPSISPDGSRTYLASVLGKLSRMDLSAAPYQIQRTNPVVSATPSTPSPDGSVLLLFGGGLEGFRIAEPLSLDILKTIPSGSVAGAGTGDSFLYSPDGARGYLVRDQGDFLSGEMWVIRLKQ